MGKEKYEIELNQETLAKFLIESFQSAKKRILKAQPDLSESINEYELALQAIQLALDEDEFLIIPASESNKWQTLLNFNPLNMFESIRQFLIEQKLIHLPKKGFFAPDTDHAVHRLPAIQWPPTSNVEKIDKEIVIKSLIESFETAKKILHEEYPRIVERIELLTSEVKIAEEKYENKKKLHLKAESVLETKERGLFNKPGKYRLTGQTYCADVDELRNEYRILTKEISNEHKILAPRRLELDKLIYAVDIAIIEMILKSNNPYLNHPPGIIKSWGIFTPYDPEDMVQTLWNFFQVRQIVKYSFALIYDAIPVTVPIFPPSEFVAFDAAKKKYTVYVITHDPLAPIYATEDFARDKIDITQFWQNKSKEQIVAILNAECRQNQMKLLDLKEKQLLTLIGNNVHVLIPVLKNCRTEKIGGLLELASDKLKHNLVEILLASREGANHLFADVYSSHLLAIIKGIRHYLHKNNDLEYFISQLNNNDEKIAQNNFKQPEILLNYDVSDRNYVKLENKNSPKARSYVAPCNRTRTHTESETKMDVSLYIAKQPTKNSASFALLSRVPKGLIPLNEYWDSLSDEEVIAVIASVSEHATHTTLFDLDDHAFSAVVNDSESILRYFLRSAPTYQLLRVLSLVPQFIAADKIFSLFRDEKFLGGISSERVLAILTNINPALLRKFLTGVDGLNILLPHMIPTVRAAFIDHLSGLLLIPSDVTKFSTHESYNALCKARLTKCQPDISQQMNAHNNPNYAILGIFWRSPIEDATRYADILSPFGFTKEMLKDLPARLSMNALHFLIYLVTGLPPAMQDQKIKALPLDQCLSPADAVSEVKKGRQFARTVVTEKKTPLQALTQFSQRQVEPVDPLESNNDSEKNPYLEEAIKKLNCTGYRDYLVNGPSW